MARKYATTGTSATSNPKSVLGVIGTAATRALVYDIQLGFAAPADLSIEWIVQRVTSVASATNNTAVVPVALDPGNTAAIAVSVENWTIEPTKTSATEFIDEELNQRASYRWVAAPGGEIMCPATAQAGVALIVIHASGTPTARATFHFEE